MSDDSPTSLKGKPGTVKRVAWDEGLPLDAVAAATSHNFEQLFQLPRPHQESR